MIPTEGALRVVTVLACTLVLVWLGHHTTQFALTRPEGIRSALQAPADFDDASVMVLMWRGIEADGAEGPGTQGALLEHQGHQVRVHTDVPLWVEQEVTVRGRLEADDRSIHAERVTIHRWRHAKRALGLLGTAVLVVLLPFDTTPYELGLVGTELTVFVAPVLVVLTALLWWGKWPPSGTP